uniref:Phosphoribosyltransferase n=1 Tax=Lympha mucosa TaxID=2045360 RepID=A0A6B9VRI6_9FLOR|nr:Phosphoribosyltransferase [Lympha mucosa]
MYKNIYTNIERKNSITYQICIIRYFLKRRILTKASTIIMNLNIYTINHPIVRNLISYIYNTETNIIERREILSQLSYILFYEATRKSIKLINLHIKKLNSIVEIALLPKKISQIIFNEIHASPILCKKIYDIIPKAIVLPFYTNSIKDTKYIKINIENHLNLIESHSQIFILQIYLNTDILCEIFHLIEAKKIKIEQIQVLCIVCSIEELQKTSQKYSNLNIYTTKIINHSKNYYIKFLENF